MKTHELLGQLSQMHQMLAHLLDSVPEADAYRTHEPGLPSLAWLFGRAAYAETYWVREALAGDDDMTARVRHLFGAGTGNDDAGELPPREHLVNWARELHDENLMRLANPALLPGHPLRQDDRLLWLIAQEYARLYELMLAQLTARQVGLAPAYRPTEPLRAGAPGTDHADVHRGHYRIGARNENPAALDNEHPTQAVELGAFRIDKRPVTNAAYLGFIEAGGYDEAELWSEEGWQWRQNAAPHPYHWRRNEAGDWYGIGLNGPFDLTADDPVSGVGRYEAEAYANWVGGHDGPLAGAVLQHEYQWEIAARGRAIEAFGRVWEWCANPFHAYTGYEPPTYAEAASDDFDQGRYALRGACLHSQSVLRRATYRHRAAPGQRALFTGIRLVFPPSDMPWDKRKKKKKKK